MDLNDKKIKAKYFTFFNGVGHGYLKFGLFVDSNNISQKN